MALSAIDTKPFLKIIGDLPPAEAGPEPSLRWMLIADLVVDKDYQRIIGKTGNKNIIKIAREFEWAKFSPVIVAPRTGDKFAIVDGQHRTTAAALRGLKKVPCQIIQVDAAKQAAAFAAINAIVTEISPMQIHAAKVAAGDKDALRLKKICAAGGVEICRYPIPANKMVKGQTLAVSQIRKALDRYGEKALRLALTAITSTRDGNVGMVRGQIVTAVCAALESRPEWMADPKLMEAFERFDFRQAWVAAAKESTFSHGKLVTIFTENVRRHLGATLKGKVAA